MSVYWLGDFVFVESGLGVRVKSDLSNTVHVTVAAEQLSATRGLCGVYNGNADGEQCAATPSNTLEDPHTQQHSVFLLIWLAAAKMPHLPHFPL